MDGRNSRTRPGAPPGSSHPYAAAVRCREAASIMSRERHTAELALHTPAKVNLFLEVLGKRPDGYHELESLMLAVNVVDSLEFWRDDAGQLSLTCDTPGLSCGPDNLVLRAAEALRRHTGVTHGMRVHLCKRIPMQAGLAGGSSDAAATLVGLNRLWQLGLSTAELMQIGATVGSDVNFFFAAPAAWCTGRGEKATPVKLGRPLDLVLACPEQGLATADVFRKVQVSATPASGHGILEALAGGDIDEIGRQLHNRLQEPAEELCPAIAQVRHALQAAGTPGCLMTGSGSTVFALCRDRLEAIRVASSLGAVIPTVPLRYCTAAVSSAVIRGAD